MLFFIGLGVAGYVAFELHEEKSADAGLLVIGLVLMFLGK